MASNSLGRVYFLLGRNTRDDAQRKDDDPVGYFSCRSSTARFLNVESLGSGRTVVIERQAGQRTRTLADGTILTGQEESATQIAFAPSQIVLPVSSKGSRTVILTTGNVIEDTKRRFNKAGARHTVSFRFPGWATILTISDALATLIPQEKINLSPSQNQIFPFFKVKGGRRYPIMSKASATSRTDARVGVTQADIDNIKQQADAEVIE